MHRDVSGPCFPQMSCSLTRLQTYSSVQIPGQSRRVELTQNKPSIVKAANGAAVFKKLKSSYNRMRAFLLPDLEPYFALPIVFAVSEAKDTLHVFWSLCRAWRRVEPAPVVPPPHFHWNQHRKPDPEITPHAHQHHPTWKSETSTIHQTLKSHHTHTSTPLFNSGLAPFLPTPILTLHLFHEKQAADRSHMDLYHTPFAFAVPETVGFSLLPFCYT